MGAEAGSEACELGRRERRYSATSGWSSSRKSAACGSQHGRLANSEEWGADTHSLSFAVHMRWVCPVLDEPLRRVDALHSIERRLSLVVWKIDIPAVGQEVLEQLQVGVRGCRMPGVARHGARRQRPTEDSHGCIGIVVFHIGGQALLFYPVLRCVSLGDRTTNAAYLHTFQVPVRSGDPDIFARARWLDHLFVSSPRIGISILPSLIELGYDVRCSGNCAGYE